jgi:hypothetical protein
MPLGTDFRATKSAADPADLIAKSAADPADLITKSAADPADLIAKSAADPADPANKETRTHRTRRRTKCLACSTASQARVFAS